MTHVLINVLFIGGIGFAIKQANAAKSLKHKFVGHYAFGFMMAGLISAWLMYFLVSEGRSPDQYVGMMCFAASLFSLAMGNIIGNIAWKYQQHDDDENAERFEDGV